MSRVWLVFNCEPVGGLRELVGIYINEINAREKESELNKLGESPDPLLRAPGCCGYCMGIEIDFDLASCIRLVLEE